MKKLLVFAAVAALLASCSNDDSNPNENPEFFAVTEGNIWVYKRYSVSHDGLELSEGRTDSVRVTGQQVLGGNTYYNFNHKIYSGSGSLSEESNELLRIDAAGYLIDSNGKVVHPGADAQYQFTRPQGTGTMTYRLENTTDVTIEGHTYTVSPYSGYYTPGPDVNHPPGLGERISYQQGVGIVAHRCRYTASTDYFEDRLVYYELN